MARKSGAKKRAKQRMVIRWEAPSQRMTFNYDAHDGIYAYNRSYHRGAGGDMEFGSLLEKMLWLALGIGYVLFYSLFYSLHGGGKS